MAEGAGTEDKDRPGGKKGAKNGDQKPKAGKVSGTDQYGQGGHGVTPAIPGKASGTEHLPAGPNGAQQLQQEPGDQQVVGKQNGVDAKEGKNGDGGGGGSGKGAAGAGNGKDANHALAPNATSGGKEGGTDGKTGKNGKADKDEKAGAAAGGGKAAKGDKITVDGGSEPMAVVPKTVTAPAPVTIPDRTPVSPVVLDSPKVSKSVIDKFVKDTGRTPEQHTQQIQGALGELQNEVNAAQAEFMSLSDQLQTKVQTDVAAQVQTFTSSTTGPGRQRVLQAYSGIHRTLEASSQKALGDVTTHKFNGIKAINATGPATQVALSKKVTAARAVVGQLVAKHAPATAAIIKKYADAIIPKIDKRKEDANKKAADEALPFDPALGSGDQPGGSALAGGRLSLKNDVYRRLIIQRGEEVGKEYDNALRPLSVHIEKKAELWVADAIKDSSNELDAALNAFQGNGAAAILRTQQDSTSSLDAQEVTAKKTITDAKAESGRKLEAEKKTSLEIADKAGKELTDNATAAGTELADRVKLRAAEDSKAYARIMAGLQVSLKKKGPHKYETVKIQIDAARGELSKLHEASKTGLSTMVTTGSTELGITLGKQQQTYFAAIKEREESAVRTEGELKTTIAKGATDLGTHVANIGAAFATTVNQESAKVDGAVAFFHENANNALANFTTQVASKIQEIEAAAERQFAEAYAQPFAKQVEEGAQKEIGDKEKKLVEDAGGLRDAFDGHGTDEDKVFSILRKCSYGEIEFLHASYNHHYDNRGKGSGKNPLRYDLHDEMSGSDLKIALGYLDHKRDEAIKLELKQARHGGFMGTTDAKRVEAVLRSCDDAEIKKLNNSDETKTILLHCRMGMSDKCSLDTMDALLDDKQSKEERHSKASAIQLLKAMKGAGTDEAKMTEILEGASTEAERQRLRKHFNEYAAKRGWETGDPKNEENDALALAIKDDCGGGEMHEYLELAKTKRNDAQLKTARLIKATEDGAGTNETLLFDALDDDTYAKDWAKADAEGNDARKAELEAKRKEQINARLKSMDSEYGSVDKMIEGETTKSRYTWAELLKGAKADGTPIDVEKEKKYLKGPLHTHLEYMVAERKLQTGRTDPTLLIAYACWGVDGTNEELINKALSDSKGEPLDYDKVRAIDSAFSAFWGVNLVDQWERDAKKQIDDPGGLLSSELGGKDWFKTRILLFGKTTNMDEDHQVNNLRFGYATSGALGGAFMKVAEFTGFTEAQSTAEHSKEREEAAYAENQAAGITSTKYDALIAAGKKPGASLAELKAAAAADEFQMLSKYVEMDSKALADTKAALLEAVIMVIEMVGAALLTIGTLGATGPALVMLFLKNLALSAGTIVLKKLVLGDQYGEGDFAKDGIAAIGNAGFSVLGEMKMITKMADGVGQRVAGKFFTVGAEGVEKGGMRIVTQGGKTMVEISEAGLAKIQNIVSAGTKNVLMATGQEIFNTATDEKTYDMKLDEALLGENSLGRRILTGAPKAFATGAVSQWINEASNTSSPDFPKGTKSKPGGGGGREALWNAIAEVGGETAGFFVYLDNYQDSENFWNNLFKANLQSAARGGMSGYWTHKRRATNLAGDYLSGRLDNDGVELWADRFDDIERKKFAEFVMRYGSDAQKATLPDAYKLSLNKQPDPQPDATAKTKPSTENGAISDNTTQVVVKPVADDTTTKPVVDDTTPTTKPKPTINDANRVDDETTPKTAKPTKTDGDHANDAANKDKPPTRDTAIEQQKAEKGHAGIEVHSHFLGNVDPSTFAERIINSGVEGSGMRKPNAKGATPDDVVGDVSGYEPMLREILDLANRKDKAGNLEFAHTYQKDERGNNIADPETGLPLIAKRGKSGDALAQAEIALGKIIDLKAKLASGALHGEAAEQARRDIKKLAKSAVEKSMRASDETDFNSSYEIRDELIKKFYGEESRREMFGEGLAKDAKVPSLLEAPDIYLKHFAEQGRTDLVMGMTKKVSEGLEAKRQLDTLTKQLEDAKGKSPADPGEVKRLEDSITATRGKVDAIEKGVHEQFAYDRMAEDTIMRLVRDGLTYTEQSSSSKKLLERYDEGQLYALKQKLAAQHPELAPQILAFEIKHVAMMNTALFGVRGNLDNAGNQTLSQDDITVQKRMADEAFTGEVDKIVNQTRRGDVVGVDIAGAEHFTFDQTGADRFGQLYQALLKAARERGEPLVLRPHVGEGANDTTDGKHFNRDGDRQMDDGQLSNYKRAKDNLDALLIILDDMAAKHGTNGRLPPDVIVRFGHATHTTPDQAQLMKKLGIIAEVNLSSNVETGSVSQKDPESPTQDRKRKKGDPVEIKNSGDDRAMGRLDDHSLSTLIMNEVPIILSTDGHSVMSTSMKREYELANQIIDRVLRSRQGIPMTAAQAAALGVPGIDASKGGNVVVKLKDIPREHQGAIIERFVNARTKLYEDANNYFENRPKQKPGDGPEGDETKTGASLLNGAADGSETAGFVTEKTNTKAVTERAVAALDRMNPTERKAVENVLDKAKTAVQRTMLERALAVGRTAHELDQLRAHMLDLSDDQIARGLTGAGVVQFYLQSCVPTAYQIAIADVDPYYAFQLRVKPEMIMDQQREVLKNAGAKQTKRPEIDNPELAKGNENLRDHIDDASMGQKLKDNQGSYDDTNAEGLGIQPTEMKDSGLHKQLEKATGHTYEILTNASLPFDKAGHGTYPEGKAPHDRILAALDRGLPVIIGQLFPTTSQNPDGSPIKMGHAIVIVAYKIVGDPPNTMIEYTVRDPASGKPTVLVDKLMDLWGIQTIAVPAIGEVGASKLTQIKKDAGTDVDATGTPKVNADSQQSKAKDSDPDKTWDENGKQLKKPDAESYEESHSRRSKPLVAKDDSWVTPDNRQAKGIEETVPLTRQEVRDFVLAKYGATVEKYLDRPHTNDDAFLPLIKMLEAEPPGAAKTEEGKKRQKFYEEEWDRISAEVAKKQGRHDDSELRTLYNMVEKEDFKTSWYPAISKAKLPLEQQAMLMHMWREELKIFVRDLMSDDNSKEVLYLRDRFASGDRRGGRFEDFVKKNLKKHEGDEDKAYSDIIDSSMRSNKALNLAKTGNEDGIDPIVGDRIREAAKNPQDELTRVRTEHEKRIAAEQSGAQKRKLEVNLGEGTALAPATEGEKSLRKELDDLWHLREQLKKTPEGAPEVDELKRKIAAAAGELDLKLADPTNKDAFLDPHVAFGLAREASSTKSTVLNDFLRLNIDAFRKAQDQARQGHDPQLRAKREIFERAIAKQVLGGALKEKVDANLHAMCGKVLDYINKLPAARREAFLAKLGAEAGGGYAGAVVLDKTDVSGSAKIMLEVLLGGNARERMIALSNFPGLVVSDMHNNADDFDQVVAQSTGRQGEFGAAEIKAYRDRFTQYLKDQQAAGANPTDEKFLEGFLKPLSTEKSGDQKAFQQAKKQEMDAKLPSLQTELPAGLFHTEGGGTLPQSPSKKVAEGQTGVGESSSLARTTITIEEAEAMGYVLSPRERKAAEANNNTLPWVVGTIANVVDPNAEFINTGTKASLPQKAGISGTTFRFMEASMLLGGEGVQSRLAMIGALQVIDAHTIYEIASAAKGFNLPYDPTKPYEGLGIPRELLEELALQMGTSLSELNGETKAEPPTTTKE